MILFEDEGGEGLQPLTSWRSVFELRLGRRTLFDEVAHILQRKVRGVWTRGRMAAVAAERFGLPVNEPATPDVILVNGRWFPDGPVAFPAAPCVGRVGRTVVFVVCDQGLAEKLSAADLLAEDRRPAALDGIAEVETTGRVVRYPWELIGDLSRQLLAEWRDGDAAIEADLDPHVTLCAREHVHIGERANIHPTASIDASGGPVFIGPDVTIGAQAVIEGPVYLGAGTRVNPRSWLHGGNAIGPVCKVGGEIDGCIICGYSNKQHDGFLGHAYVGCWVNIGAGTNNSDLKNTYGTVRVPVNGVLVDTGQQFFGAAIGDHAKLGIHTTLPTGAIVGFGAVAATSKVLPKYVPAFGWLTDDGMSRGDTGKLIEVATTVMRRRQVTITEAEVALFRELHARSDRMNRGGA